MNHAPVAWTGLARFNKQARTINESDCACCYADVFINAFCIHLKFFWGNCHFNESLESTYILKINILSITLFSSSTCTKYFPRECESCIDAKNGVRFLARRSTWWKGSNGKNPAIRLLLVKKTPRAAFWAFVVKEVEDQARPNKKSTCGVEAVFAE